MADLITESDIAKIVEDGQNYLNGEDYASAVDHFAKALDEIVPKYGDVHDVLGKVYLCYGQALLGFARDEADVVVENMVPQESNGADDGKETVKEDVEEEDDEDEESDEHESEQSKETTKNGNVDKDEEKQNGENEDVENEDNVDNLQLAWEVLELARKIFSAEGDEGKDLLVETLYYLGDVSTENENFEAAIEDLKECLKLHEAIKGKTRRLADIHFKLALAYSLNNQFDESINNLNIASKLLKDRIEILKSQDETESIKTEISEINELIPEIENKIVDVKAYKEEARKSVLEMLEENLTKTNSDGASSSKTNQSPVKIVSPVKKDVDVSPKSTTPVNDISHLVRRKRPADDTEADATPSKKPVPSKTPSPSKN